ncbi:MAG: hypothetical protein LW809_00410, partial [Vampirovibrionales bacterium]|nr:hypothetical protein [Vampirovibrionales bacterium]
MSQNVFSTNNSPHNTWGYPKTVFPSFSNENPNAKVFTQVDIKGYRPKDFYANKLWAWLQIQAQGLADVKAVDRFVSQQLAHVQKTPYVDTSKSVAELFGLKRLDSIGHRTDIERLVQNPQAYQQQIQTQSKAMKSAF